ncbi:hypothetical protein SAMD00019534_043480 [Acytostelium subglobosum LB1]|uniref:hypothetical protein n=1 Tax=Acytostelium subglobosum LB1 TaxID=1410327 RepID=UPI00064481D0|nr:hypothetical protein SAMD00019534_043480 [Acytostelium subglobosum LB1]GAM21173.1 hypothetical protein SAMD00019534_043480 [Acytostelium subglobosum LB1]|eukprot:XP_012756307.1 hypothetical protein SAMD00019534_043480 [Acytostelium subglobosum LB1]
MTIFVWIYLTDPSSPVLFKAGDDDFVSDVKDYALTKFGPLQGKQVDAFDLVPYSTDQNASPVLSTQTPLSQLVPLGKQGALQIILKTPAAIIGSPHGEASPKSTLTYDGIQFADSGIVKREKTIKKVIEVVKSNKVTLLRAPPYTGKTSLGQLLEQHLKEMIVLEEKKRHYVRRISWTAPSTSLEQLWCLYTGQTLNEWLMISKFRPVYLIMDEAHSIFSEESEWGKLVWPKIKSTESTNLHIILLAGYGETSVSSIISTPLDLKSSPLASLDINSLLLTHAEFNEMINNNFDKIYGAPIPTTAAEWIYSNTNGHVGLARRIVDDLKGKFGEKLRLLATGKLELQQGDPTLEESIMKHLLSKDLSDTISDSRAAPLVRKMSDDQLTILDSVVNGAYVPSDADTVPLFTLIKHGYLTRQGSNVIFPSPLYYRCYFSQRFKAPTFSDIIVKTSQFDFFVETCLKLFRPQQVSTRFSRHVKLGNQTTQPLEVVWQMEFYYASSLIIGPTEVAPSVGRAFGSSGFLDFYIDTIYKWGFELVSEGSDIDEHIRRFDPSSGRYRSLLSMINRWAVIDFRSAKTYENKSLTVNDSNLWVILYSEDFKTYTIHRHGQPPKVIPSP